VSGSGVMRELNRSQKADVGYHNASVAIQNERLTRERVERLERTASELTKAISANTESILILCKLLGRGFWGRLRWLLLGR